MYNCVVCVCVHTLTHYIVVFLLCVYTFPSVLVDRDNAPKWSPDKLHEVTDEMVQSYFQPFPEKGMELQLDDGM